MLGVVLVCDQKKAFLCFSAMQVYKRRVLSRCAYPVGVDKRPNIPKAKSKEQTVKKMTCNIRLWCLNNTQWVLVAQSVPRQYPYHQCLLSHFGEAL